MKKMFFFSAIAAIALTACSDQNLGGGNKNKGTGIEFRTLSDKGSRAAVTTYATMSSFTLTAWWDKTAGSDNLYGDANSDKGSFLFLGEDITRGESLPEWAYSPVRYWPTAGNVDFFATSPASSVNVNRGLKEFGSDGDGDTHTDDIITYTVPQVSEDGKQQEDFLVAVTLDQTSTSDVSGRVSLQFLHALSRVKFGASKVVTDVEYQISAIRLVNLKSKGDLDLTELDGAMSVFPASGGFTYIPGSPLTLWGADNTSVTSYSVDFSGSPVNVQYGDGPLITYFPVIGVTNALMVLPQETTLGEVYTEEDFNLGNATFAEIATPKPGKEGDFYIVVSYSAYQAGKYIAGTAGGDKIRGNADDTWKEKYIPVAAAGGNPLAFEIGRQYTFNLTFGLNENDEDPVAIGFSVDVQDWDKVNVQQ